MKLTIIAAAVIAILLVLGIGTFSKVKKVSPIGWGWYGTVNATDGIALGGYDAVSYQSGTPTQGAEANTFTYQGATWRFANADNKAAFEADPAKYPPQFGGFCGFAASKGFTAHTDPTVFELKDGKLYVFADADMRTNWFGDAGAIAAGNAGWVKR